MTSTSSRRVGRALLSFLAFPIGGGIAHLVAGPVDGPLPALVGGLIAGAAVGAAQALASSGRLDLRRWTPATAVGLAAGLVAGAALVGYETSLGALVLMGAVTGVGVGAAQAAALPTGRLAWGLPQPALWALGWLTTTAIGVDVEEQYVVFGAAGALVLALGFGLLLERRAAA